MALKAAGLITVIPVLSTTVGLIPYSLLHGQVVKAMAEAEAHKGPSLIVAYGGWVGGRLCAGRQALCPGSLLTQQAVSNPSQPRVASTIICFGR